MTVNLICIPFILAYFCRMFIIDHTLVSEEIRDTCFCCNTEICRGACCVDGDAGAPLEESEISELEDDIDRIKPFMRHEGIRVVEKNGVFDYDVNGEYVTPLIHDKDCAFVYYDDGIARCAIEKAFEAGKISFRKPISCHLYPVRVKVYKETEAVNYHKWSICNSACVLGKEKQISLVLFLREPLIRKYGQFWYEDLLKQCESIDNKCF